MSLLFGLVPRILVWAGAIMMLAGLTVFILFYGPAMHCGSDDNLAGTSGCLGDRTGLHVGYIVLAVGAIVIGFAVVASVGRDRRRRNAASVHDDPSAVPRGPS